MHDADVPANPRASIYTRVRSMRAGRATFVSTSSRSAAPRPVTADIDFAPSGAVPLRPPPQVPFGTGPRFPAAIEPPHGAHVGPGAYSPDPHPERRPVTTSRAAVKVAQLRERFAASTDPAVIVAVAEMERAAREGRAPAHPAPEEAAAATRARTAAFAVRRRRRAETRAAERAAAAGAALEQAAQRQQEEGGGEGVRYYYDPFDPFRRVQTVFFGTAPARSDGARAREEQRLMATGAALRATDAGWLARGRTFGSLNVPRSTFRTPRPDELGDVVALDAGTKMSLATAVAHSGRRLAAAFRSAARRDINPLNGSYYPLWRDPRPTAGDGLGPGHYDPEASLDRLLAPSCGRLPGASVFGTGPGSPARIDTRAMGDGFDTLKPRCPDAIPPRALDRHDLCVVPTAELMAAGVVRSPAAFEGVRLGGGGSTAEVGPDGAPRGRAGASGGGRRRPQLRAARKPRTAHRNVAPAGTPGHRVPFAVLFEARRAAERAGENDRPVHRAADGDDSEYSYD